ncbi:TPA: hypothetical protein HA253_04130 [Candidatus Woesearchaeota archaeon]|nr:hypothetical protein [Candidatus Woesearchaeota archaeon]
MPSHIRRENKECAGTFGLKAEVCSALIKKSIAIIILANLAKDLVLRWLIIFPRFT